MWPKNTQYPGLKDPEPWIPINPTWSETQDIDDDWLVPVLRNITDKLTMLRNVISENFVGHIQTAVDIDRTLVNDWLNSTLSNEAYPSRDTLLTANKLWRKYNK